MEEWEKSIDESLYKEVLTEIIERKRSPIEALDLLL
jgi:hypothetical protein